MPATKFKSARRGGRAQHGAPDDEARAHAYQVKLHYDAIEIKEVWREYATTPTEDLRNYFVEKYLPLVRYNADRIYARLPDEVDIEDLMQAGLFGLMDAIDAFDLERGVKFETYCAPRIRGAILDELRLMDWVPRLVRHRSTRVEAARNQLEMALGRKPTEAEISKRLGVEKEEVDKILKDGKAVSITSLSRQRFQSDGSREVREIDVLQDEAQTDPLTEIQRRDLKNLLTKGLSRAERLIVILYYYEEMTMKEIGATLDLSESRVSQMHSSILQRLKAQMQHREREFEPVE
ncbi:MAG: FliA/WhiG family RNA polymerase sigma factor [Phycisphaerales bacterium]|nr:FliA/WhiG family RNA polymerase sigma factor [Phycisphaerales bacterium]